MPDRDLVLLTSGFPFGTRSEPFLEPEIGILGERFSRVFVLPSHRETGMRPLPGNVTVVEMPWLEEPGTGEKWRALATGEAAAVLAGTPRNARSTMAYLRAPRFYLDLLARNVLKARHLRTFVREHGLSDAVFYDYWFENSTLALALLRGEGTIRNAVCRAHRFDVYDDAWERGPVPFREVKARSLDLVALVSSHGADYMRQRLPTGSARIEVHHLGVRDHGPSPPPRGGLPLVVTCASLLPRKRVHRVPGILAETGLELRWVHFGDGPERSRVESAARELPARVTWELRGHVPRSEVLSFYQEHPVSALLSVSESEGLPVSMMEALSFGVPVVAVSGQGIPEIVNGTTGVLLPRDAGTPALSEGLGEALRPGRFAREDIRAFFKENFEAERNFNRFADTLHALAEGSP